jgi:hypothetical protein
MAQFKRSDFSTCDAPRPGRPKTVTTPEVIDQIHEVILEDRRPDFTGKVLASIFWDQNGILLNDYLPKAQTINAEYY